MRNAGDGTPGGSSGRRHRVSAPPAAGRPAGNGGASLFTPAYRVRHEVAATGQQAGGHRRSELDEPAAPYQQAEYSSGRIGSAWDDDPAGGYSWRSDDGAWPGYGQDGRRIGNAIRGLPPIPDEPLPVYPPGPFAAWNKGTSDRSQPAGSGGPGY